MAIKKQETQKTVYNLMEAIAPFISDWVRPGYFDDLPEKFDVKDIEAKIYFLTAIHHQVRLWPDRLFPDLETRAKLLAEIQNAIDNAIDEEEEGYEEE